MPRRPLQAAARLVSTNKGATAFWLTPVQAATLAHEEGPKASPFWMVGSCVSLTEGAKHLHKLQACFKSGVGLTYDDYGEHMACGICRELSVWTRHYLLSHVQKIDGARRRSLPPLLTPPPPPLPLPLLRSAGAHTSHPAC